MDSDARAKEAYRVYEEKYRPVGPEKPWDSLPDSLKAIFRDLAEFAEELSRPYVEHLEDLIWLLSQGPVSSSEEFDVDEEPESVSDDMETAQFDDFTNEELRHEALERDFERNPTSGTGTEEKSGVAFVAPTATEADLLYPDLSNVTTTKVPHKNLILEGVCSNCAHCWQELTDSVSVQRGIGPICSKKGYSEDPVDADEFEAFVALSEFPELAEFLTNHYKPLGIRGLVNGLVRVASLNRPHGRGHKEGNEKVFSACCDAIEQLGHKKMASLLRETLAVAWINEIEGESGMFSLKTMKRETPDWWDGEVERMVRGSALESRGRFYQVRFHATGNPANLFDSNVNDAHGNPIKNKKVVWNLLLRAFDGAIVKVNGKAFKIERTKIA